MGASKKEASHARPLSQFHIIEEPFYLSKEEDDARIKRLARKILVCIEMAEKEKHCSKQQPSLDELLGSGEKDIFEI